MPTLDTMSHIAKRITAAAMQARLGEENTDVKADLEHFEKQIADEEATYIAKGTPPPAFYSPQMAHIWTELIESAPEHYFKKTERVLIDQLCWAQIAHTRLMSTDLSTFEGVELADVMKLMAVIRSLHLRLRLGPQMNNAIKVKEKIEAQKRQAEQLATMAVAPEQSLRSGLLFGDENLGQR